MYSEDKFSEESLLGTDRVVDDNEIQVSRRRTVGSLRKQTYLWGAQLLFFLISLTLFLYPFFHSHAPERCECEDHMPMYSPALEAVENTGFYHRFDGSFSTPNPYKGTPSPSIDENWDRITDANGGAISISEETLRAVNASAEFSVKLAPEIGGGYMASVEALHQLHCLNMLRQATYEDYYKDKAGQYKDSPEIVRYHLDHCIDNLRQKLMCDADAGILTYVWAKGHPAPFPDFSVQHKCRNFNALVDWVGEHQLYTTEEHGIERLPGAHELDTPP